MKVLILGGNSKRHYVWNRQIRDALEQHGHEIILHDYSHWESGVPIADIESEIAAAGIAVKGIQDYAIVAKSIGTVIATLATSRGNLSPSRLVFLGVPYGGIAGEITEFLASLTSLPSTIFVQNQQDPYGTAEGLRELLSIHHPRKCELITVPDNDTHDYIDFNLINQALVK